MVPAPKSYNRCPSEMSSSVDKQSLEIKDLVGIAGGLPART